MKVKQWCQVTHGASSYGMHGRLLVREVEMGALPNGGETSCIGLYVVPEDGEDGEDGYMASVKRRYWNSDGTVNIELLDIHVDPTGPLLEHYEGRSVRSSGWSNSMCWTTDVDPDPLPLMLASGWTEWQP